MSPLKLLWPALVLALLSPLLIDCGSSPPSMKVDGYVALVPRVLRSGETESVSLSLFNSNRLASGDVQVSLLQKDKPLLETSARIKGKGTIQFETPQLPKGDYEIVVKGPGFTDRAQVQIQQGTLLFLETDKPIYKPGQTILMRLVALNSEMRPVTAEATVEVQDAKAIKVFKQTVTTDEFGMAALQLPLSTEPNLGVWKLSARTGDTSTEVDVRVEEYVLPKYEVKVDLPKQWFLVDEPITGHVTAEYSFGKPARGELRVKASRYVGVWEEFATFTTSIDGQADFRIDPAGFVAGVPEASGMGNVTLEVAVEERATGYLERATQLVTVASAPVNIQIIPESPTFKPSLPFNVLVVAETPDRKPVEAHIDVDIDYLDERYNQVAQERQRVETKRGTGLLRVTPPEGAITLNVNATSGEAHAFKQVRAGYSPSGNFIHVEQLDPAILRIGDKARFRVSSTSEAHHFYYEVVSRDRVVFTGSSESAEISFSATPAMAPSSKLLVYQVLPTSEVAADFVPFAIQGEYPHKVTASFSTEEARPGDDLQVNVQTDGRARVGLVAADRSVFILAENRLNLQQVFAKIERLYMQPQAELHEVEPLPGPIIIPGARETFQDTGLIVLSNKRVPEGRKIEQPFQALEAGRAKDAVPAPAGPMAAESPSAEIKASGNLAEVQWIRQFFPETWIWETVTTDGSGRASLPVKVPDSITTWDLRTVAISLDKGLGIVETSLRVFQPFFLQADLPYSAIRGEEFPVKVALYNYIATPQEFLVEIEPAPWFDLLDDAVKPIAVAGNDIGGIEFKIRPRTLGTQLLKITARSGDAADAIVKSLIVEPEGVQREEVENAVLAAGASRSLDVLVPDEAVPDSARAYLAVTGSFLTQTIEGLEELLQMPFGCGEQNMILFAPDVFILKYLKGTNQLKAEILAKAETLLITGYQRELTYRRGDGSFSAFGDSDPEGSLFLSAFVLKSFSQAKGLTFIDETVLADAAQWISKHQLPDGSFQAVGFLAHQELMGGVGGKDALTAYVAVALLEAGQSEAAGKAVRYLEGRLDTTDDPYTLAITAYALELGKSPRAQAAHDRLMAAAQEDEKGIHWNGDSEPPPLPEPRQRMPFRELLARSSDIEATGYAALALIHHGDQVNASRAAKWLVGQRNAYGGFGSTQDTVVALQALTEFAALASGDVDLTVIVRAGEITKEVRITPENFDVMQVVEMPPSTEVHVEALGKGQAVLQAVLRYNLLEAEEALSVFKIDVHYDTTQVNVNDVVPAKVDVTFNPPEPVKAGMVVLDVSVPTGFAPVTESLDRLVDGQPKVKRYDIAGRKVILYIEDMVPGESLSFSFQVRALYPVRGKGATSQAYSYYQPQWKGETVSKGLTIEGD